MMPRFRSPRSVRSRITSIAAVIAMVAAGAVLTAPAAVAAHGTFTDINDVQYTYDSDNPGAGATAVGCDGTCPDPLKIPDFAYRFDGSGVQHKYAVVAIADSAFATKDIAEVTIGDYVETIGEQAFDRSRITNLTIGDRVETIEEGAFNNNHLTSVTIPDSVVTIGKNAFSVNDITNAVIGSSVETIEEGAFNGNHLTSVTIPDSVVTIGKNAFHSNDITNAVIGSSVETIGEASFRRNDLTSVTIPDSVVTLGEGAFHSNDISDLTIGDGVETIGKNAFRKNALTNITVPDSVLTLDYGAFSQNDIANAVIGNRVAAIGGRAFAWNENLTSVVFTGTAPTVNAAGGSTPSFDRSSGSLVLTYPWAYGDSQLPGGYTSPTWKGYDTHAVTTVSFKANGHGSAPASQQVNVGTKVSKPAALSASGYTFTGWFTNKAATKKFSFATKVSKDLTLYAGWEKVEKPGNGNGGSGNGNGNGSPAVCHPFPDVDGSNVHCRNIEWLKDQDITKPADGKYHPGNKVTRGSMAAFLFRLTHPGQSSPKCTGKPFPDVKTSNVFCGYIQWAATTGVAKGYPNGTFRPGNGVTRGAMAAFMQRIAVSHPAPKCTSKPFNDVAVNSTFCKPISWMKTNKITFGVGGGSNYGTTQIVNRQSMASFLHRIYDYMH